MSDPAANEPRVSGANEPIVLFVSPESWPITFIVPGDAAPGFPAITAEGTEVPAGPLADAIIAEAAANGVIVERRSA